MSAPADRLTAPLVCPECGREFGGLCIGERTGAHECPSCGCSFTARWPGFVFKPKRVIVRAENGDRDAG
jgi:hypothetical protein